MAKKQSTLVTEEDLEVLRKAMSSLDKSLLQDKDAVRKPFRVMAATWNLALADAPADDGLFKVEERPGKDEVDAAWRKVEAHAALLRGNPLWSPLWKDVRQADEAKERWQRGTRAILQKGWKNHVEGNPAWKKLWAYTEQKSSAARARLSAALADLLEREGGKDTRTAAAIDALREFSRTAAGYSRRPQEQLPLPAAPGKETKATLNPYSGYGPHRGAVREEGDGQLIKEEVREGGERVVEAFKPWFWSGMVQESLQENPKGGREGPTAELQTLISDGLRKFTDQWENGPPVDLMGGLRDGSLWYGLVLHDRPSEFVEWVDRAKKGAEWYGMMAGRAYGLVGLARKANRLEPGSYSAHDIELLKDFGDTSRIHAERLARTMTPGNSPDAEPYATLHDAGAANRELAEQLNAWRDSKMGREMLNNRSRSKAVVELIDAVNAQLPFVVKDGVSDYDQWEASYRVLRVAKAAQGVLDEAAYKAAWGTTRNHSDDDKKLLHKVVVTATNNAARLNRAPVSRSVLPGKPKVGRTTGKPVVQTPKPSAIAKPAAGTDKSAVAPGVEKVPEARNPPWVQEIPQEQWTPQKQRPSRQQNPQRSRQQPWQRPVRRVRPPSQRRQPPPVRAPGYGPNKGAARNKAEAQARLKETEKASWHVDGLMGTWFATDAAKKPEKDEYAACEVLRKACLKRPSADRPLGFREAAGVYGQIARRAHQLGEGLRHANLTSPGTYSHQDIKKLDDLADASFDHAVRLARTQPPGNNPDARAYESPYMRKKGETEMQKRWADFKKSVWGDFLFSADPQEPLVKQLESVWARRNQHLNDEDPKDDWTFAGRMGEVARAGNQLLKEYSEVDSHFPHIAEGMEKLRYFVEGADRFAAKLAQGNLPASLLPVNPRESREKTWGKSRTEGRPAAATSAPQAARAVEPATARRTPTHPARPAPPPVTGPVAQAPRRAARV
jgi:hypothetical protein